MLEKLSQGRLRTVILLSVAVWGWFVLARYFRLNPLALDFLGRLSVSHYPQISLTNALVALSWHLISLLLLVLVAVVAESLGRRLLLLFQPGPGQELAALMSSLALGLSLLAYFIFLLASFDLLAREFSLPLLVMLSAYILLSDGRRALSRWRRVFSGVAPSFSLYGVLLGLVLLVVLVGHLVPQSHFDVLVYHFALPTTYLNSGGFLHPDTNMFSGYPGNMSMLYLLGFIAGGEGLAVLLHFLVLGLALLALYLLARQCGAGGSLAALLFLTIPMVAIGSTACLADPLIFLYEFLATYYLVSFLRASKRSALLPLVWLACVFCGLAMATIYRALIPGLLVLSIAAWRICRTTRQGRASNLSKACVLMALPVLPWLGKNLFLTGNPFYPFFAKLLGGRGLDAELLAEQMTLYFGGERGLSWLLRAPWELTMSAGGGDISFLGPLCLALLPLLLVGKFTPSARWLGLFCGAQYLCLGMMTSTPRHYLGFVAYLCVLFACLLGREQHWPRIVALYYRSFTVLIVILGALSFARVEYLSRDPLGVALGWEGRDAYLGRVMINSYHAGAKFINGNIKKGESVLLLGETRTHHFACPTLYASAFDRQPLFRAAAQSDDAAGLYARLQEQGVRFILENRAELSRLGITKRWNELPEPTRLLLGDFRQSYLNVAWQYRTARVDLMVYELKQEAGGQ